MSARFSDFLNEVQADADMIQQALRIYLSERTDDLTPDEMLSELRTCAANTKELEESLRNLEETPEAVQQAALAYFEREWDNEARRASIRTVFQSAKNQLPVVETAIIAIAAMYAIHVIVTGGVLEKRRRTRKKRWNV
jgi:metal-responsive CopG/Arc/MetJ family transcriptional regulator